MTTTISNILFLVAILFACISIMAAAFIGIYKYKLKNFRIKEMRFNKSRLHLILTSNIVIFGSLIFISRSAKIFQHFAQKASVENPFYAVLFTYLTAILIAVLYGCVLSLIEDLVSRIRYYYLERIQLKIIRKELDTKAIRDAYELEELLRKLCG